MVAALCLRALPALLTVAGRQARTEHVHEGPHKAQRSGREGGQQHWLPRHEQRREHGRRHGRQQPDVQQGAALAPQAQQQLGLGALGGLALGAAVAALHDHRDALVIAACTHMQTAVCVLTSR